MANANNLRAFAQQLPYADLPMTECVNSTLITRRLKQTPNLGGITEARNGIVVSTVSTHVA